MPPIRYYVGNNSRATQWEARAEEWEAFAKSLATPLSQPISPEAFHALTPSERTRYKDVRAFVGGVLAGGERKKDKVAARTLITLDLDDCTAETLPDIQRALGRYEYVVYSTISHTPEKPRYRLVMPFSGYLSADNYINVAIGVAEAVGMHYFDSSTFQAERLMYFPNILQGAEYIYIHNKGSILPPEDFHKKGRNLKPRTTRRPQQGTPEGEQGFLFDRSKAIAQGDPREKDYPIGAFCKAYSISEAIRKFVPSVYTPYERGRYSYAQGSTAGGLIVFDDLWAYSHHSTDPLREAGGEHAVNAFDLVRIHLYGYLDAGSKVQGRSSYKAMLELCEQDDRVQALQRSALLDGLDLSELSESTEEASNPDSTKSTEWLDALELDKKGQPLQTIDNVCIIALGDPRLKGRIGYNLFDGKDYALKSLPWDEQGRTYPRPIEELDLAQLVRFYERAYKISHEKKILDGIHIACRDHSYHPVKAFIEQAPWDGEQRLETLFIDYLGAKDSKYTRGLTRNAFVSGISRIYEPGCKYDQIVTLTGKEGIGKSTILAKLGGKWFLDSLAEVGSKDSKSILRGKWIVEVAELNAIRKSDMREVKNFLSLTHDEYRGAYQRKEERHPRTCIFFATTNEQDFLQNNHGNRRFWIIPVGEQTARLNVWQMSKETIQQIWAEAYHLYKTEGRFTRLTKEEEAEVKEMHKAFELEDPRAIEIERYLDIPIPRNFHTLSKEQRRNYILRGELYEGTKRIQVSVLEIMYECFGSTASDDLRLTRFISSYLNESHEWQRTTRKQIKGYGKTWSYERIQNTEAEAYEF